MTLGMLLCAIGGFALGYSIGTAVEEGRPTRRDMAVVVVGLVLLSVGFVIP